MSDDLCRQHELKTWPEFFGPVFDGEKTFEFRRNDRDYRVGDELWLREWSNSQGYTGRECWRVVTHIVMSERCVWDEGAVAPGYVLMSIVESKSDDQ